MDEDKIKQATEAIKQIAEIIAQAINGVCKMLKELGLIVTKTVVGRYISKPVFKVVELKSQFYYRPVRQVVRSRC